MVCRAYKCLLYKAYREKIILPRWNLPKGNLKFKLFYFLMYIESAYVLTSNAMMIRMSSWIFNLFNFSKCSKVMPSIFSGLD